MKFVSGVILFIVFVVVLSPIVFFAPVPALLFIFGFVLLAFLIGVLRFVFDNK